MQRHAARTRLDRLRVEHLLDDGQVFGQPGRAFVLGGGRGEAGSTSNAGSGGACGSGVGSFSTPCKSICNWAGSSCSLWLPKSRRTSASIFWRRSVFSRSRRSLCLLQSASRGVSLKARPMLDHVNSFEDRTFCINLTPARTTDAAAPRAVRCRR